MSPEETVAEILKQRWESAVRGMRDYPGDFSWQGKAMMAQMNYLTREALDKRRK